jgi:ABC-2 type transport system ATP-binding protein
MELQAVELSKKFGDFQALNKVSFRLNGAGCYGYLGPNGAGKTTTMKIFTNLLKPSSGSALVNGVSVQKDPVEALKHVSSLVEDPEPYTFMTIREFVVFAAKIRSLNPPNVNALKEELDLPPVERKIGGLSKGQKRRVYLAAMLAQDAEVMILDEPSSGLDPKEAGVLRDVIKRLKKDKIILLSSHLLYEVSQVCDTVYFLFGGKIVDQGTLEDISAKFRSRALKVEFYDKKSALPQLQDVRFEPDGERSMTVYYDGSDEKRREILDALYPLGLRSFSDSELQLEEAYRRVIQ